MAGKQSAAMDRAQKLVTQGITVAIAAKRTGITVNSIYRAAWYKAHIAAKAVQP